MGFEIPREIKVEASAFIKTPPHSTSLSVWEKVWLALDESTHYIYEEEQPRRLGDDRIFKISIVIEEV